MSELRLNIDGREVTGLEGQTILEIAAQNGIEIPTLCHDERVQLYGSCGVCVVEAEGSPKLLRSCSTYAQDGMVLFTHTNRVLESRKTALELLLSDHTGDCRPPCVLACPAQTDCQGYVGLIACGEYKEALKLVKDKIPLPASIGRVCPHPCETACRRELVEEPISIAALKQFVGDLDLAGDALYTAPTAQDSGRKVAIIGGGPGGLSAAYFLRLRGHAVTIYDSMPHMGGMLRYGIPEYRLPKAVLQKEIDAIESMGVAFINNTKIGRDITLDHLRARFDAVIVAVGAWQSTALRCPGEELDGVVGGIDFLREAALGQQVFAGKKVAVVGGGNTAMDCARTAVRLGAGKVYNIYRRTKNEMPAEQIEIAEAEEEGVLFKNLTNPIEVVGEQGRVKSVRLQIMELGQPDASGRRAPVPVEGEEETLEIDTLIVAIGQKLDGAGLDGIETTRWGTIAADENTFCTSIPGVFAVGDATNNGADIAITAIGEAKKAVEMVDQYLSGRELAFETPYLVKSEKTREDFAAYEKQPRAKMLHRAAKERRHDFLEVNKGLSEAEAVREASRCLECGCHDYFECKLIDYANSYHVAPQKYAGEMHHRAESDDHPFIVRNPDKCILCGLCVRICDEVVGATALGLVDRGFDTVVKPALDMDLRETDCISCGQCVAVCPVGALTEKQMAKKQVPVREMRIHTTCASCSAGCSQELTAKGDTLLRALPTAQKKKDALLCMKGRFGFGEIGKRERITVPMIAGKEVSFEQAYVYTNKKMQALQSRYGKDAVAVTVSDRYTSEEAFLIRAYAKKVLHTDRIFSLNRMDSGLADVFGADVSTCTFDEMENTDLIVLLASDIMKTHAVVGMRIRRAVQNGAKLVLLNSFDSLLDDLAVLKIDPGSDLAFFKQALKAAVDAKEGCDIDGFDALKIHLNAIAPTEQAKAFAQLYAKTKKAVILFEKYTVTSDAVRLVADLAVLCGQYDKPRCGVIQLLLGCNAQGIADLGFGEGDELRRLVASGEIRGLFSFGEDLAGVATEKLAFLAVQDLHLTESARKSNVIFPGTSYAEQEGSFVSADLRVGEIQKLVHPPFKQDSFAQLSGLCKQAGAPLSYRHIADVRRALDSIVNRSGAQSRLVPAKGNTLLRSSNASSNALYVNLMRFAAENRL